MTSDLRRGSADDTEMLPGPHTRTSQTSGVRKITACVACRRLKIKCHMPSSGTPPCTRCSKRGTRCSVSSPSRMEVGDDASWRSSMTQKMGTLENFMHNTTRQLSTIQTQLHGQGHQHEDAILPATAAATHRPTDETHETGEIRMDIDSGPAVIPSSSISSLGEPVDATARSWRAIEGDLIELGVLTLEQAETLFNVYAYRLDHYLYRILGKAAALQEIRKSSRLLLGAICTVGALHCPELASSFDSCYQHFRSAVADIVLSRSTNLDDIRGLCIGAFWLRDIAWNLSSIAVTLATQQHLHHATAKSSITAGPVIHDRIRVYYLVYVCDHHFSISYGRPPMTSESGLIMSSRHFLDAPESSEDDARLVSQVQVWSIATQGLNLMVFNVDAPVSADMIPPIRRLMIALDTWRADWNEQFGHNLHVGNYPRKGVKLHYHFARLYLCSHAYRGLGSKANQPAYNNTSTSPYASSGSHASDQTRHEGSPDDSTGNPGQLYQDLEEVAEAAVESAQSILRIITSDAEIQSHLNGLPLYFDTMIAFAIVFLFKVATRYSKYVRIGTAGTLDLIRDMSGTLEATTAGMHRRHFLVALAPAVEKLLITRASETRPGHHTDNIARDGWQAGSAVVGSRPEPPREAGDQDAEMGFNWSPENFDWGNYDFLAMGNDLTGPLAGYTLDL